MTTSNINEKERISKYREGNATPVGITSTLPVEIVFASDLVPVDLNNIFISSENPGKLVSQAEAEGFPHNICAWIKGIYSTIINKNIKNIIAVTGGDCSNTVALSELLARKGIRVVTFEYPLNRERHALEKQIGKLMREFQTTFEKVESVRFRLNRIRKKLNILDELTWKENVVSGMENHLYLVKSSDFDTNPTGFEKKLDTFLDKARKRTPNSTYVRLGYLGVPPIYSDIYQAIESRGGRVVYNEVQRQFSMPYYKKGLIEQYLSYTYPYGIGSRIEDIKKAIEERNLEGLIHYTQTFCYRQIYDMALRESLSIPILTLEGDRPGKVDSRTALRIETFLEMLSN